MNFSNIRLSLKLPVTLVAMAFLATCSLGVITAIIAKTSLETSIHDKLTALTEARKTTLSNYLSSIEKDLILTRDHPFTIEALKAFAEGWNNIPQDHERILKDDYIKNNPNALGEKHRLDKGASDLNYNEIHKKYHPVFRDFLEEHGYYDIFLISREGDLVYSVFKEEDYATNLLDGEWRASDLGNAAKAALNNTAKDTVTFFDFKPYAPSHGAAASFIGTTIFDENNKPLGALVFQMPIGRINQLMQSEVGMGQTGETYIVGSDRLMRSDSRFSEESTVLKTSVDSQTVDMALNGEQGVATIKDYRGVEVISSYDFIDFNGTRWAVLGEVDVEEALHPV
ncbi:MAG: cache domain-containing protein, partial [Alphaproteobacteria bacterium]|nr:cache domain-containing protein [Alphaproteobacteria bacterium]